MGFCPQRVLESALMKIRLIFPVLVLAVITLAAQASPEVEITAEPHHHVALENQYVRVLQVEVAPHDATLMHIHHHDYVTIALGAANVSNEVKGKPPVPVQLKDGEARFVPGNFAHIARNLADTPFRNVTIEFLQDEAAHKSPPAKWDEERGLHVLTGGTQDIMFVQDGVRVTETNLQPGATIPSHHHTGPHLVVALTDLELRSNVEGQAPTSAQLKSGEIKWLPGGYTHTVTNTAKQQAKFVTLEFH
jgi:quercetin dioxygenase-like cupin family protein